MKKLHDYLSIIVGAIFLYTLYKILQRTGEISLMPVIDKIGWANILLCTSFYLISHVARAFRIALLLGKDDLSIRQIVEKQFYTNGLNLIIPFKLGEFYRILEFHKIIKNYRVSVSTFIAERSIDFFILFLGLILSVLVIDTSSINLDFTLLLGVFCLILLLFIYYIFPENIKAFNLFLAKRYSDNKTISILAVSSKIYRIITGIKDTIKEKMATLMVLTVVIWFLEVMGFSFVMGYLTDFKLIFLLAFLVFLSVFIPAGSLGLGGVQLGFYFIFMIDENFPFLELSFIYQIFIFSPAILISFVIYISKKFRVSQRKIIAPYYQLNKIS